MSETEHFHWLPAYFGDTDGAYAVDRGGTVVGGYVDLDEDGCRVFLFDPATGNKDYVGSFSSKTDARAALNLLYEHGHKFENPNC
jgi:hypothetical protein